MNDTTESAREATLHSGLTMPTLALGLASGMLKSPVLSSVTARYVETARQAVLLWRVESGRTALVETSKAARMVENRDIDDFELGDGDMRRIDALGAGQARCTCPDPSTFVKEHPRSASR